jgi:hypothetical protein
VNRVEPTNVSKPEKTERPKPIVIRKLDKIETTAPSSNPNG